MSMMQKILCLFSLIIATSVQATPCSEKQYSEFDFWLGKWEVSNNTNTNISHNKITKINNGCGLLEEYTTPTGYQGKSLNIYNKQDNHWHQTWVDNSGLLLQLKGQLINNQMVMKGVTYDKENNKVENKITWQPLENGKVRQHWQQKNNNSNKWQTVFDGLYTPAS